MHRIFEKLLSNPLAFLFPNLCEKFPKITGWATLLEAVKGFQTFVGEPVEKEKVNYSPSDEPQDFVEAYMQEISKTEDPQSSFYKAFGGKCNCLRLSEEHNMLELF